MTAAAPQTVETARVARLYGATSELVVLVPSTRPPVIAHFGARLAGPLDAQAIAQALDRSPRINALDRDHPGAALLPVAALGRYGQPALSGHRDGRAFTAAFERVSVEETADRLIFTSQDAVAGLTIAVTVRRAGPDAFAQSLSVTNGGDDAYTLDRAIAGVFLAPPGTDTALTYTGSWGREFRETRETLGSAVFIKENRRGRLSHDRWSSLIVGPHGFTEATGSVLGVHFAWSGNHTLIVEPLDDGRRLVMVGELFHPGEMRLAPGETYRSPEAYAALSDSGLDGLADRFHATVRADVVRLDPARPRPVTLNTWEGTYFDHKLTDLIAQAKAAAAIGIERFVLDDGWFGRRDDDTSSLGDWTIDPRKYPDGLGPLVDAVTGLGMEFGIWFEPEMVNPDSELYRAHPDWVLQVHGRPLETGRNQLVLDIARPEITEHVFQSVDAILSRYRVAYVKWDMNRDHFAAGDAEGRAVYGAQVRALYAVLDRLTAAHPTVEFESCSSGGGRVDFGILKRTARVWTSDCTDALERASIQRGVSRFLPPEVMGAHVSAAPNHQTGRRHTLAFRAITAMPGHFGVEMSPLSLTDAECAELAAWIALHKRLRPLLHGGLTRLDGPVNGRSQRTVLAPDGSHAVVLVIQETLTPGEQTGLIRVRGLTPDARYRLTLPGPQTLTGYVVAEGTRALLSGVVAVSGAVLQHIGFAIPEQRPETALLIEITRIEGA